MMKVESKIKTLEEIIKFNAKSFNLPVDMVKSIIVQESGCRVYVARYEKGFYAKYLEGKSLEKLGGHVPSQISKDTEYMLRATSFGLMQVMGQVAREKGFSKDSLIELCLPDYNVYYGCKHFKYLLDLKGGDMARALLNWNGGGNPNYAKEVIAINNGMKFKSYNWEMVV